MFVRAAALLLAVIAVPPLMAYLAMAAAPTDPHVLAPIGHGAFAVLVLWKAIVFPHDWLVVRSEHRSIAWLSQPGLVAVLQWAVVGLLFSLAARRLRLTWLLIAAPVVVLAVAAILHLALPLLGVSIEADLP